VCEYTHAHAHTRTHTHADIFTYISAERTENLVFVCVFGACVCVCVACFQECATQTKEEKETNKSKRKGLFCRYCRSLLPKTKEEKETKGRKRKRKRPKSSSMPPGLCDADKMKAPNACKGQNRPTNEQKRPAK